MTDVVSAPAEGQAAPLVAPVAAPVVAPVAAPVAVASIDTPAADAVTPVVYDKTGDVGLDMALDFIGQRGIPDNDPAMVAAADGDFSLLKAKLAAMGDKAKGWEQFIALAEKSHADNQTAKQAANAKTLALITEVAGGEDNWKAIKEWAGKNADGPGEKDGINAMLAAGGIQARAAVTLLKGLFEQNGKYEPKPASRDSASKAAPAAATPINRREFAQGVNELVRRFGSAGIEKTAEYQALAARVR